VLSYVSPKAEHGPFDLFLHEPRHRRSWLIFDVGQSMTEYEKILITAAIGFGVGLLSGVLLEKYREQKRAYQSVVDEYLNAMSTPGVNGDGYLRFAALQRAGAWKLSARELKRLTDEIRGRGFLDPSSAWSTAFSEQKDFPRSFLIWAKKKNVDLSKSDEAMRAIAEEYGARVIPKPPSAGFAFV
jgi:hypothetical protein